MTDQRGFKAAVKVRCDDCGTVSNVAWSPGDTCPRCGSEQFAPVPVKRASTDYEAADRSNAYALEDIRFGRLAQWAGFVTLKQFQRALHEQKQLAAAGQTVPDIGTILVRDKLLTREQVRTILNVRRAKPRSKEDADFGTAAVQVGAVTREQLDECRQLQEATDADGHDAIPLPLLLYEKRYVQENQLLALLMNSERAGAGLLHRLKLKEEDRTEKRAPLQELLGPAGSTQRKVRVALIAVAALGVLLLFTRVAVGPAATATVQCTKCGAIGGAPERSVWPVKCTECGAKAVYPMAICMDCGKKFTVTGVGYGVACPVCRSTRFQIITDRVNMKKLEAGIKAKGLEPARMRE